MSDETLNSEEPNQAMSGLVGRIWKKDRKKKP